MTTLVVEELKTTLSQSFTYNLNRRSIIAAVRPYIFMYNSPSGTFTLSLKEGATTHASKTFTSADIKSDLSTSDNYAHLWKALEFSNPIYLSKGTYTLELSHSGYSFSESSYLGWIKEHENIFNNTSDLTGVSVFDYPFSYQIFEKKGVTS